MKNLLRTFSRKWTRGEIDAFVDGAVSHIQKISRPRRAILFGSALTDHFDEASDLDLVLIFESLEEASQAEKILYRQAHTFPCSIDFLCIDEKSFQEKSEIGGVFWIAAREGRPLPLKP
ncbi:MAG: nucleotidyltransferase domain-containing protein [Deltaproteobacteria bacterium]|nr:nucleotidyltransferase domain-containing protein [Deltaproteobacteria bacterium]MBI3294711.1 nucleotidyltransferase domain-containing protein [Deltaproteobacteria bacterium]